MKAVIFDVDGVLVQSMERHFEAYKRVLEPLGIEVEPHMVYANEGRRSREVLESLTKEHGMDLSKERLDALNDEKQRIFTGFGPQPLYPGVKELIDTLHARGLRVAMVTGTNKANVNNHMNDFTKKFDVIVTADDVTHTKPHPEPYQQALHKLGIGPEEAIVVENATLGIKSAKAAGMRVVAVASTLSREELHEADVVIDKVAEVAKAQEGLA